MNKLGLDYLDLYLLHQPFGDVYGAWKAMEELYKEGKIKSIGVANFYCDKFEEFVTIVDTKPMVNQIELHPFYAQQTAIDEMKAYGCIPQAMHGELIFKAEKIGIVCPIYGHEMPEIVKEFVRKATFDTDYLYLVETYGHRHGGANELAEMIFEETGKHTDYATTISMADNFLPAFDMNEEREFDKK